MVGMLGMKVGMTHIFDEAGKTIPVTIIEAGPCHVIQVKTKDVDGYEAVQLGFGEKREKLVNKPAMARYKKAGIKPVRYVKEIKVSGIANYKQGQKIDLTIFAKGDFVDVVGTSIGKGFQGGVKRWGWKGGPGGHGSMFHRAVGSIQSGPRLSRVTKGHHLPGHMGVDTVTVQNLEIIELHVDKNIMVVRGCVPGNKNRLLIIKEAIKRPKGFTKQKAAPSATAKKGAKAQVTSAAKAAGPKR